VVESAQAEGDGHRGRLRWIEWRWYGILQRDTCIIANVVEEAALLLPKAHRP
jgi:hypothetical protein